MATASKRITRKELRQPDSFQLGTEKALAFYNDHQALALSGVGALIIVLAALWGWQVYKDNQNVTASIEFNKAVVAYQENKFPEALVAFEKVQTYRWSRYASLSHLYQTNIYLATNDLDKALNSGQRAVMATRPNTMFRQLALMALAAAEERKNQCKTAIEHFNEAQKIAGPLQSSAMLGKARCAEQLGDKAAAIASYKDYVKENPGSPMGLKLTELESARPLQQPAK
jgi:predicted negative regulator of RcsB-dependent stress response